MMDDIVYLHCAQFMHLHPPVSGAMYIVLFFLGQHFSAALRIFVNAMQQCGCLTAGPWVSDSRNFFVVYTHI